MATLKQARDKADAKLIQFWQLLQQKQDAYFAKHGKYFQLLVTGGKGVQNGEEYDFSLNLPDDEPHTIDVDFPWTDKLPFQIEVHVADGEEHSYKAIITVDYGGMMYRRWRDSNQNDSGWSIYQEYNDF